MASLLPRTSVARPPLPGKLNKHLNGDGGSPELGLCAVLTVNRWSRWVRNVGVGHNRPTPCRQIPEDQEGRGRGYRGPREGAYPHG
jgi:hypothetical protein